MPGYSIENQEKLWDLHNYLVDQLLNSFPLEDIHTLEEFRKTIYYDLLQNNSNYFRTHSEILIDVVNPLLDYRNFNKLPLSILTEYLQTHLSTFLDETTATGQIMFDLIHNSESSIYAFVHDQLIPFAKKLDENFELGFEIPTDYGLDGNPQQRNAIIDFYDNLHKFALETDITINNVKIVFEDELFDVLEKVLQEVYMTELGAMYAAVPGTEGVRPALNIAVAMYDSLDEIWETLDEVERRILADGFSEFAMQERYSKVKKSNYSPDNYKTFIKDKIFEFLKDFSDMSNEYLKGEGGFVKNPSYSRDEYFARGVDIRTGFRALFKEKAIESGLIDIEILLKNSPDPVSLIQSLDDAHEAFGVDASFPPYVADTLVQRLNDLVRLRTDGAVDISKILGESYEGMTIGEILAQTLRYPNRPDFADLNPIFKKLEKYTSLVDADGKVDLNIVEEAGNVIELGEDVTIYHSRPESQGPLATDANFHAGTYQAALDRASFKYAGKSINEMLYETLTDLNEQINAELANIEMGEDYSTRISAEIGIGDNIATIEADIEWSAYNEELTIHLSDDQDYFQRFPEYAEGFGADDYGYSPTDTLDQVAGELDISDYVDPDSLTRELPFGTGADFAWADGYKLYEITIPKDAKVLSLDKAITVEQKGQTVKLTGDRLQEAIEKGINQPGSDTVYQGIESITIGNNKIDIPAGLDKKEIEELLFGEYDVIAYKNDIEDVGSISYIVKPKYASAVRELTGDERRLFNNRVLREYVGGNPSLFKGSVFEMKRKLDSLLGQITDPARKNDANIILQYYKKLVSGDTGIENSPEYSALTRLMSGTYDDIATGVANDFYVVTPEQLSNAIEEIRKSFGDTLPEIQFESHADFIFQLEQTLAEQGFDLSDGRAADLEVVLEDWLSEGGDIDNNKFFNNFPKLQNVPDPQNVRGLVAAAGGPENIREGYVQPQYFKDKPNVPYVVEDIIDTPTNVVDDVQTAWDSIGYDKLSEIQYGDKRKGHFEFVQKLGERYSLTAQQKEDIINLILDEQEGTRGSLIPDADFAKAKNNIANYIQNNVLDKTDVLDNTRNHFGVAESEFQKPKKIVEGDFIKATTLEVKGNLHARPTGKLGKIATDSPIELFLKTPEGYTPFTVVNLWSQPGIRDNTDVNNIEVFIKKGNNPTEVIDYFNKNSGVLFDADGFLAGTQAETSFKVTDTPTSVLDELETAIARTDGVDALNKSKDIINKNPRIFGKILKVLEKLDVGDQVIQQVIKRALPRIGLGAVAGPIGIAYAVYETSLLLADAASAAYKAETTDEGFWENFGEISDKYSIAYKITKPTYDLLLDAVKADLEDNNTLYSFSR